MKPGPRRMSCTEMDRNMQMDWFFFRRPDMIWVTEYQRRERIAW